MKPWLFSVNMIITISYVVHALNKYVHSESEKDDKFPFYIQMIYFNLDDELLPILEYKIKLG